MVQIHLDHERLPDEGIFDLLNRDAALWLAASDAEIERDPESIAALIGLPWRMVFVESTSPELRDLLLSQDQKEGSLASHRGFMHLVASDPSKIPLPRRALPIFFLNGVRNAREAEERDTIGSLAATRRRLNMYKELALASPARLVIAGSHTPEAMAVLGELWEDDFRGRLALVSPDTSSLAKAREALKSFGGLSVATFVQQSVADLAKDVAARVLLLLPSSRIRVRIAIDEKQIEERDITTAELPEHPVLDRYRLIRSEDLVRVAPDDLSKEDVAGFFDRSKTSWRPFSAGLPWIPDRSAVTELLDQLRQLRRRGADSNSIRYIWSEPGAGATTLASALAFEAARSGFPSLIAGDMAAVPNGLELAGFLYRALPQQEPTADGIKGASGQHETPWLVVFEEPHWEGHEAELKKFLSELRQSGRPVLVLLVLQYQVHSDIKSIPGTKCLTELTHELSKAQAIDLGKHLNTFLRHLGEEKQEAQWVSFWEQHRPDDEIDIASFWIALEFWLRGLIELGDSIQGWLWSKFKEAGVSPELARILLQIASYSIQRRSLPEALIRRPNGEQLPLSVLLEDVRYRVPALGLVQTRNERGRCWSIAHDILARYFITSAFFDRKFLANAGLGDATSQVELRLQMLGEAARNPLLGERQLRSFAIDLAVNVFKLEPDGNAEFFGYWRDVLRTLDSVPASIRNSSRAFNHHVAISRRRVAIRDEFDATDDERRTQLLAAIENLEFALQRLEESDGDEGDLNLLNTLALTYQNLADMGIRLGESPQRIMELRQKASETTRKALARDPSNSFVLETAAKNLLQRARIEKVDEVSAATEALAYVFQAVALDRSSDRQAALARLTQGALELLKAEGSEAAIHAMCARGEPYGYLAQAWLILTRGRADEDGMSLQSVTQDVALAAIDALMAAPRKNWLLLRLQYDLVVHVSPMDIEAQLSLLDELGGTEYRMPPQLRLEQAILLHQAGRHEEGTQKFTALRATLKQQPVAVAVPERLRWLLASDRATRLKCEAQALDNVGFRSMAKVRELKNAIVPFVPQDFGYRSIAASTRFKCFVTFGSMGPFLRPATEQV